ncbi:DNA-binding transcriptional regulator AraC [compost metagenome]
MTNESVQGFLDLNIDILKTVEEIHSMNTPAEWGKVKLKGLTFKLLSQCVLTASDKNKSNKLDYKDVMRVIQLKESLQLNNNQIWPKTEVAARQCMMSRSKFLRLFKLVYNKNYYDLYQEIRMQTAAEMLERGSSVAETGRFVGFVNTSHFSKVFKDHFFIEPSQYKK